MTGDQRNARDGFLATLGDVVTDPLWLVALLVAVAGGVLIDYVLGFTGQILSPGLVFAEAIAIASALYLHRAKHVREKTEWEAIQET